MKDGSSIEINLVPEKEWYFNQQEKAYLISAIRNQTNIDINQVERIEKYFIPQETEEEVYIAIGI